MSIAPEYPANGPGGAGPASLRNRSHGENPMSFRALIVDKAEDGTISQRIGDLTESDLPEADVTVAVEYSTLNYKDGLCLHGQGGLVRK